MIIKPTTGYGVPAKPTTSTGPSSKVATAYPVAGSEGGVTLGDMTVTLGSLVVRLDSGAISTLQSDKEATPSTLPAKPTTGYIHP